MDALELLDELCILTIDNKLIGEMKRTSGNRNKTVSHTISQRDNYEKHEVKRIAKLMERLPNLIVWTIDRRKLDITFYLQLRVHSIL